MASSMKPPDPPAFDAKAHEKALYESIKRPDGKPYLSLAYEDAQGNAINFVAWQRWQRQLRDTIMANAIYLDDTAGRIEAHIDADNARHKALSDRVAALEAQQVAPFPGSG